MFNLYVNGRHYQIDAISSTPLLWALRDNLGLLGTRYSCGEGICGNCTVLIDGEPTLSCVTPIESVIGADITTIEGLAATAHPLIEAWLYKEPGTS